MSDKPLVIQTEHLSQEAKEWLAARCALVQAAPGSAEFDRLIGSAAGLVIRTYTIIDAKLLDRAPKLKVIGRAGVGVDNIDVATCKQRGIQVVYTPDANTQAVVEYVLGLLSDALRPRVRLDRAVDAKEWNRLREQTVGRRQMDQLTLGILGLGRVGKGLARACRGVGMKVRFTDVIDIPPGLREGAEPVDVRTLFATSDVVSVHIDGRSGNRGFVGRDLIGRMKPDGIFINTSRGFVVDNLALATWAKRNAVTGALALLDVHEPEPFPPAPAYPLLGLPNVWLYPHLASRTEQAMNNMSWVVRDVVAVLEGRKPEFAVPQE